MEQDNTPPNDAPDTGLMALVLVARILGIAADPGRAREIAALQPATGLIISLT